METSHSSVSGSLPPISELFKEAWDLTVKKALKLFLLNLFILIGYIGFFLASGLILFGVALSDHAGTGSNIKEITNSLLASESFIWTGIGLFFAYFLGTIVVSFITTASSVLLISDRNETLSPLVALKQGAAFILPLFITGVLMQFFTITAFFIFIIPAFIVGLFLIFSWYIVILEGKRGIEALKMSVGIVSSHFGAVFGRLVLFWIAYFVVVTVIPNTITSANKENSGIVFMSSFLVMAVNLFAGWYASCYMYLLYRHARDSYDDHKKVSLNWIYIVALIGLSIMILLGNAIYNAVSSNLPAIQKTIKEEFFSKSLKRGPDYIEVTELPTTAGLMNIENKVFEKVNTMRTESGLKPLIFQQTFCAYATRRHKQLMDFKKFDDYAGFLEDTGKQEIWNSFFNGYNVVNTFTWNTYKKNYDETPIATFWANKKDPRNGTMNPSFTHACVRATEDYVTIVIGGND